MAAPETPSSPRRSEGCARRTSVGAAVGTREGPPPRRADGKSRMRWASRDRCAVIVGAASLPTVGRRAELGGGRSDGAIREKVRRVRRRSGKARLGCRADGALRHLDDAQLDRLRDAVAAEARRRGRLDGKTSERGTRRPPAPVTPGQERLVLVAFQSGVKPAAIAREFRLSRAQVEGIHPA